MSTPSPVTLLAAVALVFAAFLVASRRNSTYRRLGSLALTGHVIIGVFVLPLLPYSWDIEDFHTVAVAIRSGLPADASTTVGSFAGLQALVYTVFPADSTVIAVLNGLCAVLIAVPVADLAYQLYPRVKSVRGLLIAVLFLPLPFIFLTVPMRDTLGVLLFFSLLAAVARMYAGEWWLGIISIPLWGALMLLRPELGAIMVIGAAAGGILKWINTVAIRQPTVREMVALAAPPALIGLAIVTPRIPVAALVEQLEYRAVGGGAYLEGATYETSVDVVLAAPARALYFQYAPFPLQVTSTFDLAAVTMLPILVVLTVSAYRSARECERDIAVLGLLLSTYVLGIVGYGLVDSNFGTTVRHRIPFTFILCIFAAPTLERWANLLLGPTGTVVDCTSTTERVGD
jgi:hypothetical protein